MRKYNPYDAWDQRIDLGLPLTKSLEFLPFSLRLADVPFLHSHVEEQRKSHNRDGGYGAAQLYFIWTKRRLYNGLYSIAEDKLFYLQFRQNIIRALDELYLTIKPDRKNMRR